MSPKSTPPEEIDPSDAWKPWQPGSVEPWNRKWAAHLLRRAAFGYSREELIEAERLGPQATLDLLLEGRPQAAGGPGDAHGRRPAGRRARRGRRPASGLVALLHAPGWPSPARKAHALLAQSFRHQSGQGAEPRADVPSELPAPRARAGPFRPVASGDQPRRRDARLARFQQQCEGQAE